MLYGGAFERQRVTWTDMNADIQMVTLGVRGVEVTISEHERLIFVICPPLPSLAKITL